MTPFWDVSQDVVLTGHSIERGFLILGQVFAGKDCSVGMMSVVMPNTSLDNCVTLAPMSMVTSGTALPPYTTWEGSPVRPKEGPVVPAPQTMSSSKRCRSSKRPTVIQSDVDVTGEPLSPVATKVWQLAGLLISLLGTWLAMLPMICGAAFFWQVSLLQDNFEIVALVFSFGFADVFSQLTCTQFNYCR